LVVPALVLVLGATTACGDDSDDGVATAGGADGGGAGADGPGTESNQYEQILEFYACLREHGMDVADPEPGGPVQLRVDPNDPDAQAAMEACQDLAPNGGEAAAPDAEGMAALREFTQCMRDNGIDDMPDPGADGSLTMPEGVDLNAAEAQAAIEECRPLLAGNPVQFRGGGGQ
jgi:hypothetical protein